MIKKLIFFLFLILIFDFLFLILKPGARINHPSQISIPILTTHFPPPPQSITLIATGDIMLGRSVNAKMRKINDFTYPFLKTAEFLKSADFTFGNLESPLVLDCPTTNTGMVFCADPKAIEGLTYAGFDVFNLANNHILNYGQSGLVQTIEILKKENVSPLLPGTEQIIEIKKTRFGFLGFDLTGNYNLSKVLEQIKEVKDQADVLIVSFHWGEEYAKKPSQRQINLAHQAIDSGADLILGHHPHAIQPTEEYSPPHQNIGGGGKGKLIVYSLGNFVFDQPWSEETKKGMVGKFTFQEKKLTKTEFKKIYIRNLYQPEFEY